MNHEPLYDYGKGLNAPYWIQEIKTKMTTKTIKKDNCIGVAKYQIRVPFFVLISWIQ